MRIGSFSLHLNAVVDELLTHISIPPSGNIRTPHTAGSELLLRVTGLLANIHKHTHTHTHEHARIIISPFATRRLQSKHTLYVYAYMYAVQLLAAHKHVCEIRATVKQHYASMFVCVCVVCVMHVCGI